MKYSKEVINGVEMTVVWHSENYQRLGINYDKWWSAILADGSITKHDHCSGEHIATALPALPKHPKPEDAALLYRYMAEGITPYLREDSRGGEFYAMWGGDFSFWWYGEMEAARNPEITHATDKDGNKISVAITEGE